MKKKVSKVRNAVPKFRESLIFSDQRPHQALNMLKPTQFEDEIMKIPIENRKEMRVYTDLDNSIVNELRNQLNLFSKDRGK